MRNDVGDLAAFYETPLGQIARRYIRRRIRTAWPDARGLAVLGAGYPIPYLRPFLGEAERVVAMMPASQGVVRWPRDGSASLVALCADADLPIPDESMDLVLLVHSLEVSDNARHFLREVWRVVRPNGRILIVVPNRRGLWARLERTPFGHGRPFAPRQLQALLRESLLTPLNVADCLYTPPLRSRLMLRTAPAFERLGGGGLRVGGVLLAEATKQIYAVSTARKMSVHERAAVIVPTE